MDAETESNPVQELGLDMTHGEGVSLGEATLPEGACAPGTWFPRAGVLVTYADVIAGSQARQATLPNMSVTVDLALDVADDDALFERRVEEIVLRSRVLRSGKRMVVTETVFAVPGARAPFAVCTGSFSSINSTFNFLGDVTTRPQSRHERPLLTEPLLDRVGIRVTGPGTAEIDRRSDLGNSTGTLMGGMTALVAEAAAASAAEADTGRRHRVTRLLIRYLAPVRVGPARATASLLPGARERLARVSVHDAGASSLFAADVTAACVPVP